MRAPRASQPSSRHRGRNHAESQPDVPPVLRALVAEQSDVFLELEPRISLLWCDSHMAWHRVRYSVWLRNEHER